MGHRYHHIINLYYLPGLAGLSYRGPSNAGFLYYSLLYYTAIAVLMMIMMMIDHEVIRKGARAT